MRTVVMRSLGVPLMAAVVSLLSFDWAEAQDPYATSGANGYHSASDYLEPRTWDGFFAGIIGTGAANGFETQVGNSEGNASAAEFSIGALVGYNVSIGNVVAGVEGDYLYNFSDATREGTNQIDSLNEDTLTMRVKLGLPVNNMLLFGTLGGALGSGKATGNNATDEKYHLGWTWGLGTEVSLYENWTARFEYRYLDLSEETYSLGGQSTEVAFDSQAINMGLFYNF